MKKILLIALSLLGSTAYASTILINFETLPVIATGPSLFASAGPAQTIVVPNVATFTGGVILGNATAFPAQSFATSPNIYATAGFGSGLSSTLSIFINPAFGNVNEVSFPVFNGATQPISYVVTAYNGASVVGTQTFTNLPANTSSGFGIVDLTAASITSVTIAPLTLDASCCQGWDFGIDSVALNQSVRTALSTPEPASFGMMGAALLAIFEVRRRVARK